MKARLSAFTLQILRYAIVVVVMAIIALLYRLTLLVVHGDFSALKGYGGDVAFSFIQGARFDLLIIIYFLIPLLAFAIFSAIIWQRFFETVSKVWACIAVILFSAALIGDFFYYNFFGTHYNIIVFGIVDDDTTAVLKSMWTDFPVIRIVLFLAALSVLICWVIGKIYRSKQLKRIAEKPKGKYSLIVIILLTAFFMRGRLGMFPLRMEDAYFSKNQFVNTITLNAIFSFKAAYVDYKKNQFDITIDEVLNDGGFASEKELAAAFTGLPFDSIQGDALTYLLATTPPDSLLAQNKPHVIFIQMEGMGLNMMKYHSDTFQVLGKLATELPYCITFRNFLPFYENTIFSLEGLLTSSAITPVSLTSHANVKLHSAVTIPFHNAGYITTFVTGAKRAWRNLNVYLPAQGFDNYESKENIKHDIPEAIEAEWGVYDEYMFQQIWNRIDTATSPQFIFGMTITNHTPFMLPPHYSVTNMQMPDSLKQALLQGEKIGNDCFSTYRYTCDCLADFIHKVRNSPLGDKVIIAASGDHSVKGMVKVTEGDYLSYHGVPLILYVPQRYMKTDTVDVSRWGSHKDVFPTLFNLALSNSSYYKLGADLLSLEPIDNFALDMPIVVMDGEGAYSKASGQQYRYCNNNLVPVENDSLVNQLKERYKLWETASKYIVIRSINDSKK